MRKTGQDDSWSFLWRAPGEAVKWVGQCHDLNARLRSPQCRTDAHGARFEITDYTNRLGLKSLYTVEVTTTQGADGVKATHQVRVSRDEKAWGRKKQYLGFVLLVAHASLPHSASALAGLYRAKDMVERDFRLIKDAIELRPVYHHTDPKVRAHVTICMLALLLKRALEARLQAAGALLSAKACLERLVGVRLNRFEEHAILKSVYSVTRPNIEQRRLLESLGMTHLTDDKRLAMSLPARRA